MVLDCIRDAAIAACHILKLVSREVLVTFIIDIYITPPVYFIDL